jgi:hypothetical protein
MARDDVIASRWKLAFDNVQIRPADAARTDFQKHMTWYGHGSGDIPDRKRMIADRAGRCQHRCAHWLQTQHYKLGFTN